MTEYVYIVTTGEYSDYHIEAVFDSEEKAREYCEKANRKGHYGGETGIEIYPLNNRKTKDTHKPITAVKIDLNGKVIESREDTFWHNDYNWDYNQSPKKIKYIWGNSTRGYDVALKVARDKLNKIKAEQNNLI